MSELHRDGLVPELLRPEYVSAPELLLTSLAWRAHSLRSGEELPLALAYRSGPREFKSMSYRTTEPDRDQIQEWERALGRDLEIIDAPDGVLGRGTSASLAGVKAPKAKGQAATPLTPRISLLQNTRGLMGKRNPYNIGAAIEQMYALGGGQGSATQRWLEATEHRLAADPLLASIDRAVWESLLPEAVGELDVTKPEPEPMPIVLDHGTPFAWFVQAWDRLTGADWVAALPARRWVDWATTVLRTALGFGYLWEAQWLEGLALSIAAGSDDPSSALDPAYRDLMPWVHRQSSTSVRDVAPGLKGTIQRGASVRGVLAEHLANQPDTLTAAEAIVALSNDEEARSEIRSALSNVGNAGANTWEAVRYALLVRERSGRFADHYGMLEARGRYLVPEPATEWIVVLGSLAAPSPDTTTTAGVVLHELRRLGTRPPLSDLVELLETSGLARGSADADQAVEVRTAY